MKTLLFMRHCQPEFHAKMFGIELSGYDSLLTPAGQSHAHAIAKQIKKNKTIPDKVITSDVPRAKQTGLIVADFLGMRKETEVYDDLNPYNNNYSFDFLKKYDESINTILVTSHDVTMQSLLEKLASKETTHEAIINMLIPDMYGILVVLECPVDSWADLSERKNFWTQTWFSEHNQLSSIIPHQERCSKEIKLQL